MAEPSISKSVITYQAKDGQQVELTFETIKRFLVQGRPEFVSNQEMVFFMGICKSRGLNPFAKDCFLVKYTQNDPEAIIVSIDFFRKRARAMPDCQGWQKGIILNRDGEVIRTTGLMLDGDELLGGWFRGRPQGWEVAAQFWCLGYQKGFIGRANNEP